MLIVVIVSMTLHEIAHAYVGYWLGDATAKESGRLSLNPIKHIDPVLTILLPLMLAIAGAPIFGGAKPVPFNFDNVKYGEWGVAAIAIAGPLTNLCLAFLFYIISNILGLGLFNGQMIDFDLLGLFVYFGVVVNIGFFVFNMIPIPPLDGSRVLYVFAPDFFRRIMEIIESYGVFLIFLIVFFANSFIGGIISKLTEHIINLFNIII